MIFALAGNQNCGKTTLFNQLTGSNQHVGNFPGVTVEHKEGTVRGHKDITIVDLPGIYSLSPYTAEEVVTRDFLLQHNPDAIINIIDATNIERNLYLSIQLMDLNIPMVIALNMMDEVRSNGGTIKTKQMQKELGVPVIPIAAAKNEGVAELIEIAIRTAQEKQKPKRHDFCSGAVHRALHSIALLVEDHAQRINIPPKFAATKLAEGDSLMLESLGLSYNEAHTVEHTLAEMEDEVDTDRKAAIADMRYSFIDALCSDTVVKPRESKQHKRSVQIDHILTHKYLAIPMFLLIMLTVFWLTFGVIGSFLSDLLAGFLDGVTASASNFLIDYGLNPVVHSLVIDGVFAGVGSVISFIPTIVVLFFFLSILEDSGYMARVAFVMDKLLRKIGLSGRSFVPMLIGFGCSVPAIMATRTLSSERDRTMTIMLTPFMSCSAKLPIYGVFTMAFFAEYRALVMLSLYVLGMAVGIVSGLILKKVVFSGNPVPFVMELPNYRLPSAKNVLLLLWDKAKDFLTKAFTVIFVATIIIWFFQTFDTRLNVVNHNSESMLADIGRFITPVFVPLGFGDWRAVTALLTGFTAKETVVSTLAVLTGANMGNIGVVLQSVFTPWTAFIFLVFTLLYTPCVAAISTVRREMRSGWAALVIALYQCTVAWMAAFLIYRLGLVFI